MNDKGITLIIVVVLSLPFLFFALPYLFYRFKGATGGISNAEHERFSDFVTGLIPHYCRIEYYEWTTLSKVLKECQHIDFATKHFEANDCDTLEKRRSEVLSCLLRAGRFKKQYCVVDQCKGMSRQEWRDVFLPKEGSEAVIDHFVDISKNGEVNFRFTRT